MPIARNFLNGLMDCLLPGHCVLCGLPSGAARLCRGCDDALPRITVACRLCAVPLHADIAPLCGACLRKPPPWSEALAALVYEFPVNHIVRQYKFHRKLACGQILADELAAAAGQPSRGPPEVLIPVPLDPFRQFSRAFNQADLLARQLGRTLGIPVNGDCLARTRRTRAQSGLGASGRRKNLKGAFSCAPVDFGRAALVDDVMTTGATMSECVEELKSAGADQVSVWVAARAPVGFN